MANIILRLFLSSLNSESNTGTNSEKDYRIGTLHYNWSMSAHASQAFSMYTSA